MREIDRCLGCSGVWFDVGELVVGLREIAGVTMPSTRLRELAEKRRPVVLEGERALACPRCKQPMQAVRSGAAPAVVYARCPGCQGRQHRRHHICGWKMIRRGCSGWVGGRTAQSRRGSGLTGFWPGYHFLVHGWCTAYVVCQRSHDSRSRMREIRTSGSVGALGGQPPGATLPRS